MRNAFAKRFFKFAIVAGCVAVGTLMSIGNKQFAANQTRTYFIAADEVSWDYAPSGINQITGQPFDEVANVFVQNGPEQIGKVYLRPNTGSTPIPRLPPGSPPRLSGNT